MKVLSGILFSILLVTSLVQAVDHGEFSTDDHRPVLFSLFMNMNSTSLQADDAVLADSLGSGFELYFLLFDYSKYSRHKLLYMTLDAAVHGFKNSAFNIGTSTGLAVRTYIPFFKLTYGTGVHVRPRNLNDLPRWGLYGTVGVDFHKFFLSSRVMFHPTDQSLENELRFGCLFSGKY